MVPGGGTPFVLYYKRLTVPNHPLKTKGFRKIPKPLVRAYERQKNACSRENKAARSFVDTLDPTCPEGSTQQMATEIVTDNAKLVSHKRVIAEREQTIEALRAENAKLHTENAALQKECEEQNASRCDLIQENAKLRAENERLRETLRFARTFIETRAATALEAIDAALTPKP